MTDRELLELAAKAARIALWPGDPWRAMAMGTGLLLSNGSWIWNPIEHDGDALRLAVQLSIEPKFRMLGEARTDTMLAANGWMPSASEPWTDQQDRFAATRRAIVRAAAEIGKAMP